MHHVHFSTVTVMSWFYSDMIVYISFWVGLWGRVEREGAGGDDVVS